MVPVEIEISVPWGIIAGKSWGDPNHPLILAFHGYQDNANSFDRLIPHLPETFHYVCLDLPCHGKSSHFATKGLITSFDFILSIKLIMDHFKRKKYILLGHSFGGQLATVIAQLYPDLVEKLITLDAYYLWPIPAKIVLKNLHDVIEKYEKLHILSEETAPVYTMAEAVKRVMDARVVPICEESARVLIQRSLIPVAKDAAGDKYKISTSQQLKYHLRPPFSGDYQVEILREHPIVCPFLIVGASAKTSERFRMFVSPVLHELKQNNRRFVMKIVEGSHDVHIDHPERVAAHVTPFLLNVDSKL